MSNLTLQSSETTIVLIHRRKGGGVPEIHHGHVQVIEKAKTGGRLEYGKCSFATIV